MTESEAIKEFQQNIDMPFGSNISREASELAIQVLENCSVKCKNISDSPIWEYNGESLHVVEWAEKIGINTHCLLHRKDMGWTIEEILTTPLRGKRNVKC